jgi:hypothetical protein
MTLKIAYFQPIIIAADQVPPVEFSKIFNLVNDFHTHTELNDLGNPLVSARGGQQVQIYPNNLGVSVDWLVTWLESVCQGYMDLVTTQSSTSDLKYCRPVVTSIWTIKQQQGDYQEMHSHPGGNISGNIYVVAPELETNSNPSDAQINFRFPQTRDITKFVMNDNWKFSPQAGTFIVFPSYLPHGVYPWKGNGSRIVMAFDARLVPVETDE